MHGDKVESAMGKPPIPFWDKYGLVVVGVLVVGLVYVLVPTTVERDQAGVIIGEGEVGAFQIQIGDCFDDDLPLSAQPEQAWAAATHGGRGRRGWEYLCCHRLRDRHVAPR